MRISVAEYAKSIGKSRQAVHEWIRARKSGKKNNLPSSVKIETIAGHTAVRLTGKELVEYNKFIAKND